MKYIVLILTMVFLSCKTDKNITKEGQKQFKNMAQNFQTKYMEGATNCEIILSSIDKDVQMSEIQFSNPAKNFTYEQLEKFCPHLPKKEVINTETEQRLLSSKFGYDYVSQLYLRKSLGDSVRETTSRIWELKNNEWKVIQMNSSLNKACD